MNKIADYPFQNMFKPELLIFITFSKFILMFRIID